MPFERAISDQDQSGYVQQCSPARDQCPYRLSVVTPQGVFQWVRHQNCIRNDITTEVDLPFGGRRREMPAQVPATDSSDRVNSTPTTHGR
ncbi:hypothetical protein MRX96_031630 [Rhipicephalus microplus]